ncbi:dTDP-4-amino-4,6-dideoxygalactose transaminase [Desulfovibrio sp. JC010]|uniref:dTDP-4-amino-4,6-dideoxygalactose transaminase n=1 Tax=Desulfovibrio sp. JC010 TaxID=2593641 RepID=UPI0013D06875|nr:dTDP-4-amino-4,6-dideoxygalactose transaminase [Desulfovibrio sp. JC010]NDV27174.1 dTDP-4-amino-4,6-dideoxygalactose transaminase [Desulfovibrio sp. JC010]
MNSSLIPFNRPYIVGKELYYISKAVLQGNISGDGAFTDKCHKWMEERFDIKRALLTHSCTAALEMGALLADVGPGDEVIMPSFTFVSTANAFVLRGATVKFVDIRPDTLNINEQLIEAAITSKTKAIVPVHYAGVGCEMDYIMDLAADKDLLVIEDAAQAVNATYNGKFLGSIGHMGCYSFHETKNFISGEGGALAVNDERFVERAEIIREKGTDRSKFFRGEVDKYTWVDLGSSYLPSEIIAAFLYAQLEESSKITKKRTEIFSRYSFALAPLANECKLRLPHTPECCNHNGHMFYVITRTAEERDSLIEHLRNKSINAVFHYLPLHSSPMGRKISTSEEHLPYTDDISARLLRLPCYYELSERDQDTVIDSILDFYKNK